MPILIVFYAFFERTIVNRLIRVQLRGSRNIADKLQEAAEAGQARVGAPQQDSRQVSE